METIGIKLADGSFYPILEDGKAQARNLLLTTVKDNQTIVHVDLYRSKLGSMEDAVYVDTLEIENLNPHGNGEPNLNLDIALDENNELSVQIKDQETGTQSERKVSLVLRSEVERDEPVNFALEQTDSDKNPFEDMFADDEQEPVTQEDQDQSFEDIVNSISGVASASSPTLVTEEEMEKLDSTETVLGTEPDSEDFSFDSVAEQKDTTLQSLPQEDSSFIEENKEATSLDLPEFDSGNMFEEPTVAQEEVSTQEDKTLAEENTTQEEVPPSSDFDINDYIEEPQTIDVTEDVQQGGFEQLETLPLASEEDLAKTEQNEEVQEVNTSFEEIEPVTEFAETFVEEIKPEVEPVESFTEEITTDSSTPEAEAVTQIETFEEPVAEEAAQVFAEEEKSVEENNIEDSDFEDLATETASMSTNFVNMDLPTFDNKETIATEEQKNKFELPELKEIANSVEDIDTSFDLPDFDTPSVAVGNSYVSEIDNFEVPDFNETNSAFDPIKPENDLDFDDIFDKPTSSNTKNDFAPSGSSGFSSKDMFSDLYDKETMEGKSSTAYDDDFYSSKRKTKLPVIICVACAVICIFCSVTFLVLRNNKTSQLASTTTQKTVEPSSNVEKSTSVEQSSTTNASDVQVAKTDEKVSEKETEKTLQQEDTSARENEIVIATEFSKVVPEPPVKQSTKQEAIRYKVNWGDTLWDIANAFYKNPWRYTELAKYNNIENPNYIKTGSYILIPAE